VVHAVLAPSVGRASFWSGYRVIQPAATPTPSTPIGSVPDSGTSPGSPTEEKSSAADYMTFSGTSTKLTRATRTKLAQLVDDFPSADTTATIVSFTDKKETKSSVKRAQTRAKKMHKYLQRAGWLGDVQTVITPASTSTQTRGALVYATTDDAAKSTDSSLVSSLIVRVKKGRSITTDDGVRGSDNIAGEIGQGLQVGTYLGLRMYRIDFAEPVSPAVAERVARQLMKDKGIAFAEPDSVVEAQISRAT